MYATVTYTAETLYVSFKTGSHTNTITVFLTEKRQINYSWISTAAVQEAGVSLKKKRKLLLTVRNM